jgi:transcriptional regulator with XRE-family HTH domain
MCNVAYWRASRRRIALAKEPRRVAQTPEIMRRRLRVALRQARDEAGLTQRAAADTMEWSVSKIIRIEQGAVAITPIDLRALLAVYNVTDEKRVQELVDLARRSKRQSWSEYKDVYSQAALTLFGSEPAAKNIYSYEPTFVPGLLQTEEYAQALLVGLGYSEENIARMVSRRLERQELLDLDTRPNISLILGEAVVSRAVGGRRIMRRQLERIREIGARPGISIQILPFSAGVHPKMGAGAFTILEFEDESLDDLLYLETATNESTTREDSELIAEYRDAFVKIEAMATKPDDLGHVLEGVSAVRFEDKANPLTPSSVPAELVE